MERDDILSKAGDFLHHISDRSSGPSFSLANFTAFLKPGGPSPKLTIEEEAIVVDFFDRICGRYAVLHGVRWNAPN